MDDGWCGTERSNSRTAKVSGCVQRGSGDENDSARLMSRGHVELQSTRRRS